MIGKCSKMGRKPVSSRNVTPRTPVLSRQIGCGTCEGCKQKNCGKCKNCKDMVCFGGKGTKKTRCLTRVCSSPVVKKVAKYHSLSTPVGRASPSATKLSPKSVGKTVKGGNNNVIVMSQSKNKLKVRSNSKKEKTSSKKVNDSKGSGTLSKGSGTPLKEAGALRKESGTSLKGSGAPSKGSATSPKGSGTPVKLTRPPLKGSGTYLKGTEVPSKGSATSPKGSGTPVKLTRAPLKGSGTSSKGTEAPSKGSATSPKGSGTSPKRLGTSPNGSKAPLKQSATSPKRSGTSPKGSEALPKGSATPPKKKKVETPDSRASKTCKLDKKKDLGAGTKANSKAVQGKDVKSQADKDNASKPVIIHHSKSMPTMSSLLTSSPQGNDSPCKFASVSTMTPISKKTLHSNLMEVTTPTKPLQLVATTPPKSIQLAATNRLKLTSPEKASQMSDITALPDDTATMPRKKDIQLPKVKLDSMTKTELKEFIPRLLKLVTGRDEVFYSRRSARPEWWPDDVPWAASRADWYTEKYWMDNLKSVVKNCYKYVGKEELIQSFVVPKDAVEYTGLYPPSPLKMRMFPQDLFLPFSAEIYICFFCEKEFLSKDKMRSHQKGCNERPPNLHSVSTTLPSENNVNQGPPCMSPKRPISQKWSDLSRTAFTENIGLVPKHAAAKLREQRPSLEEINCEIVDDVEPMSPVTPKTPKSLISQLSREDSGHGSRKRLSYSISMDKPDIIVESDSDSETETGTVKKPVQEMNLLDIPISSLLGQRVKNNIHVDSPLCIVEDTGSFCRTPVKNSFLEKLRKKPMAYPVLYRPRRIANLHKQNHVYRFKKSEVKEFMCRVSTGLNLKSLEKLKLTKKFSIRLRRLSRRRLLEWIPRGRLDRQFRGKFKGLKYRFDARYDDMECVFPSGPTLLAKNIDKLLGLKIRNSQTSKPKLNHSLSLSNCISEEMEAEVSKQKLTLYRSLLYEMSVLKAAVVIEDIGKSESVTKNNNASDTMDCRTPSLGNKSNDQEKKSDYPNLRTILLRPNLPSMPTIVSSTPVSLYIPEKKETKQSNECSLSIISVGSSDSESLLSTCCQACSNKQHGSPCYPSPNGGKTCVCVHAEHVDGSMHEPLHVQVDMPVGSKTEDYGIPSPVSVSSESPYPPSVFKAESTPQGKSVDLSPSSSTGRESRHSQQSTQSPVINKQTIAADNVSKMINLDRVSGRKKWTKRRHSPITMLTRSCSVTPSGSPLKRIATRFNSSSLPSSPSKSQKPTLPLDVKSVCKKLKKKSSDSVSEKGNLSATGNLTKSPKLGSPLKRMMQFKKAVSKPASSSRKQIPGNSTPPDSPARGMKRKSSLPLGKVIPSKLRKVVSDNVISKQ